MSASSTSCSAETSIYFPSGIACSQVSEKFCSPLFPWGCCHWFFVVPHHSLFFHLSIFFVMGRRSFTRQPENSKQAHLRVLAFNNTTKIQRNDPKKEEKRHEKTPGEGKKTREDPKREKKRVNMGAAEGKNSAKFWVPHPSGPQPSGPHFF